MAKEMTKAEMAAEIERITEKNAETERLNAELSAKLAAHGSGENLATFQHTGGAKLPESSGEKVFVGSKLPMALLMQNCVMRTTSQLDKNGIMQTVRVAERIPGVTLLHGNVHPVDKAPKCKIVYDCAFTEGVDKDAFEQWAKDNNDSAFIANNLVFAEPTLERAINRAKEYAELRSNFEPMLMDNDPRTPRPAENTSPINMERAPAPIGAA